MSDLKSRANTNYIVTAQQIVKLERGLLSLRQSSQASPEAVDAIAAAQYREILRLRAELDAAMGFAEEPCDLVASLSGPDIGIGVAPARAIADFISNLHAALQRVTAYLVIDELPGRGRMPQSVTQATEFQFTGAANGSMRLKLSLPEPGIVSPKDEFAAAGKGLILMLETVEWVASSKGIEELRVKMEDERLTRLLLSQVQRITPKPRGAVRRIAFSSRLIASSESCLLSHKSIGRIQDAIEAVSEHPIGVEVKERGRLRAGDLDKGDFSLRQRPNGQPALRCIVPKKLVAQSVNFLVHDVMVEVTGVLDYNNRGRPSSLRVYEVYEVDSTG